jgi:transposase-like protein
MHRFATRCGRLGNSTMPIKPNGCCAISPAASIARPPGVAASILKGLDEMVTVNRLGLPPPLRRSLACTNGIENMMGTVRRICHNVKRWRNAKMALRCTAAGMMEAHASKHTITKKIEPQADAA